jgi:hypothetical protein
MKFNKVLKEASNAAIAKTLYKVGKSKSIPDSEFDPEQLKFGTEVELEHGAGKEAAKEIAKDHLKEIGKGEDGKYASDKKYYVKSKVKKDKLLLPKEG